MKLTDLVPKNSDYLTKDDTTPEGRILTVSGFRRVTLRGDNGADEQRVVLTFSENVKPMVLNRSNAELLELATGESTTEGVRGKRICVYRDDSVMYGGRRVGGLRIRSAPQSEQLARTGPAPAAEFDDEVPL